LLTKALTALLWGKDLDGTNNAAERSIRTAVAARKVGGGSRGPNGAQARATLASLLRTASQQGPGSNQELRPLESGKFLVTNMDRWGYWRQIIQSFGETT